MADRPTVENGQTARGADPEEKRRWAAVWRDGGPFSVVYVDSTAVVGPLATEPEPHSWDLCVGHAGRITAPRGWELVRHAGPLPSHPDEDDLVALADAVREGRDGVRPLNGFAASFSDPALGAHGSAVMAPPARRPQSHGRRRGHLRVLPDDAE